MNEQSMSHYMTLQRGSLFFCDYVLKFMTPLEVGMDV